MAPRKYVKSRSKPKSRRSLKMRMRLRGGKTDASGKHVLGSPFDVKDAFKNEMTRYTKNGALQSEDTSQIVATSAQVYDYIEKNSNKNNDLKTFELGVSRSRRDKSIFGKHINAKNEVHQDVLTPTDEEYPESYLLYKYNKTEGRFYLADGVLDDADPETLDKIKTYQIRSDLKYKYLKLREEVLYYRLVKENQQQIYLDLINPKENSGYFKYLATLAGVSGVGAGAASAAGAAGAGGAGLIAAPVAGLIAAPVALAGAAAAPAAGAVALVGAAAAPAAGAVALAGAAAAPAAGAVSLAGAAAALPGVVAGVTLGLVSSFLAGLAGTAVVGAGAVAVYNYWTRLTPEQKSKIINDQKIVVTEALKTYYSAFTQLQSASRERINFEISKGDNEKAKEYQSIFNEDGKLFGNQDDFDKEFFAGEASRPPSQAAQAVTQAAASRAAQAAASDNAQAPQVAAKAAETAAIAKAFQAAPAQAAQAAQAARQTQVPTLATAAANNAMGQRLNLFQRPDYVNRYLERVMMRRRMPSPRRRMPSPRSLRQMMRRRTPSPRRRTPSPRRRTPSPRRRTPSRRKVTRKRKTPSLKRKIAARRR